MATFTAGLTRRQEATSCSALILDRCSVLHSREAPGQVVSQQRSSKAQTLLGLHSPGSGGRLEMSLFQFASTDPPRRRMGLPKHGAYIRTGRLRMMIQALAKPIRRNMVLAEGKSTQYTGCVSVGGRKESTTCDV